MQRQTGEPGTVVKAAGERRGSTFGAPSARSLSTSRRMRKPLAERPEKQHMPQQASVVASPVPGALVPAGPKLKLEPAVAGFKEPASLLQKGTPAQEQVIGELRHQLLSAKAVIRVLSMRLDVLHKVAEGCNDLLALPACMPAQLHEFSDSEEMQQEHDHHSGKASGQHRRLSSELEGHKAIAQVLSSQFEMMAQVVVQSSDLALLNFQDDVPSTNKPISVREGDDDYAAMPYAGF